MMESIEVLTRVEVVVLIDVRGKKTRVIPVGTRLYGKVRPDRVWCLGLEPCSPNILPNSIHAFPACNHSGWKFVGRPYLQSDFDLIAPERKLSHHP